MDFVFLISDNMYLKKCVFHCKGLVVAMIDKLSITGFFLGSLVIYLSLNFLFNMIEGQLTKKSTGKYLKSKTN